MTQLQIYRLAMTTLLNKYYAEVEKGKQTEISLGRKSEISENRLQKIDTEIKWLHDEIVRLERE